MGRCRLAGLRPRRARAPHDRDRRAAIPRRACALQPRAASMIVRQAANVLDLLEFFVRRKEPATLSEIADSLGWPRSSTFNLIQTLVDRGYLYEPRPRSGYYPS